MFQVCFTLLLYDIRDLASIISSILRVLSACQRTSRIKDRANFRRLLIQRLTIHVANEVRRANAYVNRIHRSTGRLRAIRRPSNVFLHTLRARYSSATQAIKRMFLSRFVVLIIFRSTMIRPYRPFILLRRFNRNLYILTILQRARVRNFRARIRRRHILQALCKTRITRRLNNYLNSVNRFPRDLNVDRTIMTLIQLTRSQGFIYVNGPIRITTIRGDATCNHNIPIRMFNNKVHRSIYSPLGQTTISKHNGDIIRGRKRTIFVNRNDRTFSIGRLTTQVQSNLARRALNIKTRDHFCALIIPFLVSRNAFSTRFLRHCSRRIMYSTMSNVKHSRVITNLTSIRRHMRINHLSQ